MNKQKAIEAANFIEQLYARGYGFWEAMWILARKEKPQ